MAMASLYGVASSGTMSAVEIVLNTPAAMFFVGILNVIVLNSLASISTVGKNTSTHMDLN